MKILILLLFSFGAKAQLQSFIVRGDTLFAINPSTGVMVQLTKTGAIANNTVSVLSNKTLSTFNYGVDVGSTDSYTVTLTPAPTAYTAGMIILFKANTVNTGAASINVNGLGVKTIVKRVNTTLANGDIPALSTCLLIYDGTNFTLINPVVN